MSYVKVGFASTNLDITELDGDPPPQNSVRGVGNEEQGMVQSNALLGQNLEMQDEVMQPCITNITSYKNMVIGERMEECVPRLEQNPIEEIFWEPRRKMKGIRIEEHKFGEY